MTIQPTVSFSFVPTCQTVSCFCCCCSEDDQYYPKRNDKFKPTAYMTDKEVEKANERFRAIIIRKLDPLPLNNDEFLDRLVNEEGVNLEVTRENPLTKERLDKTVKSINKILKDFHID
ncbi:MAG: hypothetical protein PQJ44_07055 [Sphaerochaetaceae bacterium]|nr:hypothetical protein [Sphaerochaetaceae bacterium]